VQRVASRRQPYPSCRGPLPLSAAKPRGSGWEDPTPTRCRAFLLSFSLLRRSVYTAPSMYHPPDAVAAVLCTLCVCWHRARLRLYLLLMARSWGLLPGSRRRFHPQNPCIRSLTPTLLYPNVSLKCSSWQGLARQAARHAQGNLLALLGALAGNGGTALSRLMALHFVPRKRKQLHCCKSTPRL